jgi:hypothetical protein
MRKTVVPDVDFCNIEKAEKNLYGAGSVQAARLKSLTRGPLGT